MKIRWTRNVVSIGVAYLVVCGIFVFLWDFVFAIQRPFLTNIVVGLLTIIGGFLLAYWLVESARFGRELERKKRVVSALKSFKNSLLPWIFHYAHALSGEFGLYDSSRIYTRKYKDDIPLLEDIFGKRGWDKNGKLIHGSNAYDRIYDEMLKCSLAPQFLYGDLNYGLRQLELIERRIREFPSLVEEVDPDVAKIVHLSEFIRSRITELQEWEKEHDKKRVYIIDGSTSNLGIRANLKTVGHYALDAIMAIDANLEKLETEL